METIASLKTSINIIRDRGARQIIYKLLKLLEELEMDLALSTKRLGVPKLEILKESMGDVPKLSLDEAVETVKDTIDDLADDGKLNKSNKKKAKKSTKGNAQKVRK